MPDSAPPGLKYSGAVIDLLMTAWLAPDHDEFSLLWLDAWQARVVIWPG
jgi:hypothetical protein